MDNNDLANMAKNGYYGNNNLNDVPQPYICLTATLMATIRVDAITILGTFNLTETEQKDIKEMLKKFTNCQAPKVILHMNDTHLTQ